MTRLTRRRLALAAATAAVLVTATACSSSGSASDAGKPITLSFLSYNYGTPDTGGQGTQDLIDAFEKANPTIKIKPEGVAIADALTRVRTDTAAGSPPDVAQVGWSKLAAAYGTLPLTPVQDIPPAAEWHSATTGMSQPMLKAVEHDGKVAAMPYTISTPTLFYNATLFTKAGLDPKRPPTTIDEARTDGLAIAKTGTSGVYFDIANASKSDFLTQSVIASNGGSLVSMDGKVTFDQQPAVEALTAMQQLTKSGAQPAVGENDAIAAFKAGKLGMLVTSTALLSSLEAAAQGSFDLRTAAMPGFTGKPAHTTFSGAGLIVLAKDQARRQAAWQFIKFLTSAQGFTIITSKIGYLPLRPDLVRDPNYLAPYYRKDARIGPALTQLDSVTPYTFFAGNQAAQAVATLQDDAVEPIVLHGADPASTLAKVAKQIRSMTGQ
ncbi:MAG TPA: ABC transporter substrate-binding protein [Jatrophihabitantaceae bacterium]|jgi:multiple sugar transport system substrate-binding protein